MRFGMSVPLEGVALSESKALVQELEQLGYTDVWSSEANGTDAFTPLALAALWAPSLRLGQAIVNVYIRGPALLAQTVAALCEVAPGRVIVGLGTSSNVIVEDWNGIPFDRPLQRVRDTLRFLRLALAGERVDRDFETFKIHGFRLARPPVEDARPQIYIAGLRARMLRLAAEEADGVILNWLSAGDVGRVAGEVGNEKPIVARIFCCPSTDTAVVRQQARRLLASYLNVPVYREFHRWLGREEALARHWELWSQGDRKAALEAIPDEVIDDLLVHGSPEQCRQGIAAYVAAGVAVPVVSVVPFGVDVQAAIRELAPRGPA